jgi:hypothetical protein
MPGKPGTKNNEGPTGSLIIDVAGHTNADHEEDKAS